MEKNIENGIKPNIDFVLVSLCSYKRPKLLKEALLSINQLNIPDSLKVEVLLVDNDVEKSAQSVAEKTAGNLKLKLNYVTEEKRGIANARNRVLEEAIRLNASHILFFDDDEFFDKDCLLEHIKLYENNNEAIVISGPTKSVFKDEYPDYVKNNLVYKQKTTKKTGLKRDECACGNVFFPVSIAKDKGLRFSTEYLFMGGEDGDFFNRASKSGYTIVWNNEAIIYETVPEARATVKYIMKKCYYNGYAGASRKFKNSDKKQFSYILKEVVTLLINFLIVIPSLLGGLTVFYNVLGVCFRTKGKIDAVIKKKPYNFYEQVYGE